MAWTNPRTWVASEVVTAALMNTHVRDNLKAIGDAWTSYTPVLTASGSNPVLGTGSTQTGAYMRAGKLIHFTASITFGSSGASFGSGTYRVSLPFPAKVGGHIVATGRVTDSSVSNTPYITYGMTTAAASYVSLYTTPTTAQLNVVASTVPITFAVNDGITVAGTYEAD